MKLILAGATGLVGRHLLALALDAPGVTQVVAPTRRVLPAHPRLLAPMVDFGRLPEDADWWHADAAICALGTTMRDAGSKAAFRRVDHDYPLALARLARAHGTPAFVLNSAKGANPASWTFYSRVKGELEQDVRAVGFASLTLVRPGLIGGARDVPRRGEHVAAVALRALQPALPRSWHINPAGSVARAMLDAAMQAPAGVHCIESDRLLAT